MLNPARIKGSNNRTPSVNCYPVHMYSTHSKSTTPRWLFCKLLASTLQDQSQIMDLQAGCMSARVQNVETFNAAGSAAQQPQFPQRNVVPCSTCPQPMVSWMCVKCQCVLSRRSSPQALRCTSLQARLVPCWDLMHVGADGLLASFCTSVSSCITIASAQLPGIAL